jgi:hypothetical protein
LQDAQLDDALLTATRVEASVGGGETRRTPKELDVTLDGGHKQQCVGASFIDGHVGDDPAIGLLHLYARPKFRRLVQLALADDLSPRLEEADDLSRRA